MSKIILFCSLFFIISAAEAADVKLAIVDVSEVEELIKIKVMAMPENAEAKAKIAELNKKLSVLQEQLSEASQDRQSEASKKVMQEFSHLHQEINEVEKTAQNQIKRELVKAVKDVAKDRYLVVMDSNYHKEAILTKNAEIIDITIDVKEYLLLE